MDIRGLGRALAQTVADDGVVQQPVDGARRRRRTACPIRRSGECRRRTCAWMRSSSRSVAASNSSPACARVQPRVRGCDRRSAVRRGPSLQRPILSRQRLNARRQVIQSTLAGLRFAPIPAAVHAAIAHQHHAADAEAILELLDLRAQRSRISRVAVKYFRPTGNPSRVHNSP